MLFTVLTLIAITLLTALGTVKTNNRYRLYFNIKSIYIFNIVVLLLSFLYEYRTGHKNDFLYVVIVLSMSIYNVEMLKKKANKLKESKWYKAGVYESVEPTNDDVINGTCAIKINDAYYHLNGRVYSNKSNIVVYDDGSIEQEVVEYNMFYIQQLFMFDIALVYLQLSNTSVAHGMVGALALLSVSTNYARSKFKNNALRTLVDIMYKISFVGSLALCILLIFNKV